MWCIEDTRHKVSTKLGTPKVGVVHESKASRKLGIHDTRPSGQSMRRKAHLHWTAQVVQAMPAKTLNPKPQTLIIRIRTLGIALSDLSSHTSHVGKQLQESVAYNPWLILLMEEILHHLKSLKS